MAKRPLVTPAGILSYPQLDRPKQIGENQPPRYSCSLIIDAAKVGPLQEMILKLAEEEFGPTARDMLRREQLTSMLRSGNEPGKIDDPNYAGKYFISVYRDESKGPPQLLKWVGVGQPFAPIMDKAELYAGCLVQLNLGLFTYKHQMKSGVSAGLNGVLLLGPGTRIGGSRDSAAAFAESVDVEAAKAAQAAGTAAAEEAAAAANAAGANPW